MQVVHLLTCSWLCHLSRKNTLLLLWTPLTNPHLFNLSGQLLPLLQLLLWIPLRNPHLPNLSRQIQLLTRCLQHHLPLLSPALCRLHCPLQLSVPRPLTTSSALLDHSSSPVPGHSSRLALVPTFTLPLTCSPAAVEPNPDQAKLGCSSPIARGGLRRWIG